jgi:hypothetical protein
VQALSIISSVAQTLSPLLYAVFIVVIYFQLKEARRSVREVQQEFLAAGRPVVAVHDEYDPESGALNLAVENVGQGPAKYISFEFSRPLQASDGVVISRLPVFEIGLTSLAPGGRVTCYWDDLHDQMRFLRRNGLEGGDFEVYVTYTDLPGTSYSNRWDIQPAVYEGLRAPPRPEQHTHDQAGQAQGSGWTDTVEGAAGVDPEGGGGGAQDSPPGPTGEPATTAATHDQS